MSAIDQVQVKSAVSPLAVRVLDLFSECDRVDAMPSNGERDRALADLLNRVRCFETEVPVVEKEGALREAMEITV